MQNRGQSPREEGPGGSDTWEEPVQAWCRERWQGGEEGQVEWGQRAQPQYLASGGLAVERRVCQRRAGA